MIISCHGLKGGSRRIEFQALLDLHQPDIVLGYESKLDKDILTYSVFPQYFTVFLGKEILMPYPINQS